MKIEQNSWTSERSWDKPVKISDADLVFVFADTEYFKTEEFFEEIRERYPDAYIVGCSSSGSVMGTKIHDNNIVVTAIKLQSSYVKLATATISSGVNGVEIGQKLADELMRDAKLKHVLVFADGLSINGSDLARGLNAVGVKVTGGLAGDGSRFGATFVVANAPAKQNLVAAIGFYGDVNINQGCQAGWDEFGAERIVTKSVNNVVYEFDNQPALELYKRYLGEQAIDLPASGLRFPLSVQANREEKPLIRTLLAVNEAEQSLTFAGDVPHGYICKLMKTNLNLLIDNAGIAAKSAKPARENPTMLCLVVSCVGRRIVMGQLTEEELEIVGESLGVQATIAGFYSYGELAPFDDVMKCQLHNQTMTLTTIYE